jgi:hypothetical protein
MVALAADSLLATSPNSPNRVADAADAFRWPPCSPLLAPPSLNGRAPAARISPRPRLPPRGVPVDLGNGACSTLFRKVDCRSHQTKCPSAQLPFAGEGSAQPRVRTMVFGAGPVL